ncbi:MAG: bifunctional 5,10-methylene-tetrahydrofolate dehydrogenase/5,10-methylene-tetrahydrofolate cyclohydrolase, partial [Pyramidobacter sp.]|nr:bifunctional 5,10-methylene-tetrahydrofolate dehydrogenase/5,10-methylene-tetrahydrofolate cyclohydrolase [Pyramidobacter sp.]
AIAKNADILIAAAGRAGAVDVKYLRAGQTVIDVGINVSADGKICGDVRFEDAADVAAITPVLGGVGAVTTSVLAKHVIEAARRSACPERS